jgi:hypothetical protein
LRRPVLTSSMIYLVSTQRSQMVPVVLWALSHQRTMRPLLPSKSLITKGKLD